MQSSLATFKQASRLSLLGHIQPTMEIVASRMQPFKIKGFHKPIQALSTRRCRHSLCSPAHLLESTGLKADGRYTILSTRCFTTCLLLSLAQLLSTSVSFFLVRCFSLKLTLSLLTGCFTMLIHFNCPRRHSILEPAIASS